ncbi:HELICASE SRCAP-RELATED [Salix viminalis]|uniref:HELICASE SRCAP-RELATED n=1 Tax=Salix viminalis TaxID=40686 RepID=A0A9Q0TPI8_SALVM|nr:HELICASE SRCAP-RELATED [Salix viminalis]
MASKGPRSKLDHETRARRQKALEAPREPRRPKTHWDHVLEEMVWLSKDFESERKWKLAQAKKVALRASKGMLDQATRGEKKLKEEEQRVRKVALNISKDVKKFWVKIEKLVLYKHQMELDEKKKKALDKQLEFLLGQTERYSTMLAENLVDKPSELYAVLCMLSVFSGSGESSENGAKPSANGEDHCERKGNMSAASDMEISCSPVSASRRCGENNGALPIPGNDLLEIRNNETRNQLSISDDPAKEHVPSYFSDEQA